MEPYFRLDPEPQVQFTPPGGGSSDTQILENGANLLQDSEQKSSRHESVSGAESAGMGGDIDNIVATGRGTSRERDYKRKRRPRPHNSLDEDLPLHCAVCGDVALGCVFSLGYLLFLDV